MTLGDTSGPVRRVLRPEKMSVLIERIALAYGGVIMERDGLEWKLWGGDDKGTAAFVVRGKTISDCLWSCATERERANLGHDVESGGQSSRLSKRASAAARRLAGRKR